MYSSNYGRRKFCYFCRKKVEEIDYKDTQGLRRHLGIWLKIRPAKDTGTCAKHQRKVTEAIKRARFMALLAYSTR
ncbi:30S ribosomal protein S18 [Candidatus Berkelbacteria bacterium RIFCSPHIGHO2_12_FULL_36_9]|uniref:Small ribosomal subunit protein bS18 n=1 Tax=Candidatus Berkelbacteria bacterium RIFCSPHIGHO2_12_FULL_36_9 TaxID=1797469 RepID=A0A1F5EKY8_9BACT|nr:MAG: 30S ribosomal protein S18 [Candidatus Berkelbacteria bacterium RIFCSPHIGHO2_12_FULL_36_9]